MILMDPAFAALAGTIEVRRGESGSARDTVRDRTGIGAADVDRVAFGVVPIGHDDDLAAWKVQIDPGCVLDGSCDEGNRSGLRLELRLERSVDQDVIADAKVSHGVSL